MQRICVSALPPPHFDFPWEIFDYTLFLAISGARIRIEIRLISTCRFRFRGLFGPGRRSRFSVVIHSCFDLSDILAYLLLRASSDPEEENDGADSEHTDYGTKDDSRNRTPA